MDDSQQDNQYLRKRLDIASRENDLLRKENGLMRKELLVLKQTFTNIVSDKRPQTANTQNTERFQNENSLRQILEMQRSRIDELDQENEQMKIKYEKFLFQNSNQSYSKSLTSQHASESSELYELRQKNAEFEETLKKMAQIQARELIKLKQKIAQQDAEIIINSDTRRQDSIVKISPQNILDALPIRSQNSLNKYQVLQGFSKKSLQ